ncbi:hypothetical protein EN860_032435 [Mesorhizobium sp. M00.F.Ca.ET.217.01.1.1]|nr:MAG: hypothetical protein EOS41_29060 [Mesorhizobium sp.]TGQ11357.1 hypothetical protein EN860_032435 [Mesorhizobium sp. M00.F.Ca.ET.217.01.1.1]TGV83798.1 hypothetical protein EN801_031810 [Mesorhizobium sp. M00.F.Ca.ET.158.01.1.1]TIU86267.1 MAG: hypothetical protein E5W06_10265 [Mesorhizobium sp.]
MAGLCAPCQRFAGALTGAHARLGADVVSYSFIVMDLRHLLLAGVCRRAHPISLTICHAWSRSAPMCSSSVAPPNRAPRALATSQSVRLTL